MKKFIVCLNFIILTIAGFISAPINSLVAKADNSQPMLAIIIDDFGGFEQSGVETMLSIDAPITCAIMPDVDNTTLNVEMAKKAGKEIILHMPMQAHVNLPFHWYGNYYIGSYDSKEVVYEKLEKALKSVDGAKGFNIHIGSGVCQNPKTVSYIYDYAKEHDLFFVDSRTHLNTTCDKVAKEKNIVYLGRSEFLEPEGNRSYEGVKHHLLEGAKMAQENGYAIVIGHVGSHGGQNTANAIKDTIADIEKMGIKIVSTSELYKALETKSN